MRIGQIVLERAMFEHRSDYLELPLTTPAAPGEVMIELEARLADDRKKGVVRLRAYSDAAKMPVYHFDVAMAALLEVDAPPGPM